ncbi:unnamed protein product [Ceratitis capitata]|uniref:(Mediterranean fruit fly) hypothetical protein n=1 Tax=Ceratitis capitata TaxID=7213 RepID=A0A811UER2_CERCA|nr:unnamed protein product [Ceratitis capitata]
MLLLKCGKRLLGGSELRLLWCADPASWVVNRQHLHETPCQLLLLLHCWAGVKQMFPPAPLAASSSSRLVTFISSPTKLVTFSFSSIVSYTPH